MSAVFGVVSAETRFRRRSKIHRADTDKSGTADLATIDGVGRAPWFPSRRYYEGSVALKIATFEYRVAALDAYLVSFLYTLARNKTKLTLR